MSITQSEQLVYSHIMSMFLLDLVLLFYISEVAVQRTLHSLQGLLSISIYYCGNASESLQ